MDIIKVIANTLKIDELYAWIIVGGVALVLVLAIVLICAGVAKKKKKQKEKVKVVPLYPEEEEKIAPTEEIKKSIAVAESDVKPAPQPEEEIVKSLAKEKKTVKKVVQAPAKTPKKLSGKWFVEKKGNGEYISKLLASNGEEMLASEIYSTEEGARNGIATIIKGVDSGKFVVYQDKNKNYYYKLKTANNKLLCAGHIYKSKEQCEKAVESVKRLAKDSPISIELVKGVEYINYIPQPVNTEAKKGARGKWRIEVNEDGAYSAKLYASNGQLMLATEQVSQKKSAENAIVSVKKNSLDGNFIIDRDKFGRYYYKLRNAQKSVICIGEAYDTLDSCTNAIESVRRFAQTATFTGEEE